MKILLLGKNGQLGWEAQRTLAPLGDVFAFGSGELDIAQLDKLGAVIREIQPQIIVNAAAYTDVDRAESEPERAMMINAQAPGVMAEEARAIHAVLIHYSTDYVFDGSKGSPYTETDETNPLNVYGQSKLAGEQAVGQVGGGHVILRTSWVYSLRGNGFVNKILSWSRNQKTLRVVTDQIGSPTWTRILAEVTSAMLARGLSGAYEYFQERSGVYHLGGLGSVSRFDFTKAILEFDPHSEEQITERIEPALTADFPTPARRPLITPLDCSCFESVFGLRLPGWEESLRLALEESARP